MKSPRTFRNQLTAQTLRWASAWLAVNAMFAYGQTPVPAPAEEVLELSPFTVNAENDQGYQSANTLSGTRLNTDNRYVGVATTEITAQLLKDLAINNFEEVLNYVPNSAPAQSGGLSSDPTGNESIFGVRYRVRGFLLKGFSRDFFITRIAPDAYNSERMSFSRGPNSILFGIGEPGGVTNAVTTRAGFKDTNEVAMRFDTWDSTRYSAAFNRVLIKDKLALKVAALTDDQRNFRNPWHNQADRYFGTITLKPFKNTTLRVSYEKGDTERLNARAWAPSDGITPWVNAGSTAIPANRRNITLAANRSTALERSTWKVEEFRATPWQIMAIGNVDGTTYSQGQYELRPAQNNVTGFASTSNGGISFTDDTIIPQTANVLGSGNKLNQHFNNGSLFFEQKIAQGLYFEAAYNKQISKQLADFTTGANDYVYVDILPTLRSVNASNPTLLTGTVVTNPNYGKYFVYNDTPTSFAQDYIDETARAMMSYEFDFKKHFGGKWGTILGNHNFAALYESYNSTLLDRGFQLRNAIRPPTSQRYDLGSSWIGLQHYIDISKGSYDIPNIALMYPRIWKENAADIPGATPNIVAPMWLGTSGTHTLSKTNSKMFAMQNYFWDKKIVTTFGWRNDAVDSWSTSSTTDAVTGLRNDISLVSPKAGAKVASSGTTSTKGVVVTPISWLGFFYNESNNFRPSNADQLDIFGNVLPFEAGEGKDYGIKLYLLGGKVTGSVSRFKTDFRNQSTRGPQVGPIGNFNAPRVANFAAIQNYYTGLGTPALADIWNTRGYFNNDSYFDTQDYAAKGWEVTLTANPTDSWRITLNVSKQSNVTSNVAPTMRAWAKDIRTKLTDPVLLALPTTTLAADGVTFNTVAQNLDLLDQRIVEIASLEGFADQRQPELSANLVTAYDFKTGPLKNFGVGGSYRWRGRAVVGYGLLQNGNGALDGNKPYWGDDSHWFGLFVSYRAKVFKKVKMRLQLNIDNVLDADKSNVMLSREVSGQRVDSRWALQQGRSFALSSNFEF